jgi:hypothetical protein
MWIPESTPNGIAERDGSVWRPDPDLGQRSLVVPERGESGGHQKALKTFGTVEAHRSWMV